MLYHLVALCAFIQSQDVFSQLFAPYTLIYVCCELGPCGWESFHINEAFLVDQIDLNTANVSLLSTTLADFCVDSFGVACGLQIDSKVQAENYLSIICNGFCIFKLMAETS